MGKITIVRKTIFKFFKKTILVQEVENQLWTTLYDYPSLKACNELLKYMNLACRTAYVEDLIIKN